MADRRIDSRCPGGLVAVGILDRFAIISFLAIQTMEIPMEKDKHLFIRADKGMLRFLNAEAKKARKEGADGRTGAGSIARQIVAEHIRAARKRKA